MVAALQNIQSPVSGHRGAVRVVHESLKVTALEVSPVSIEWNVYVCL
jgi:hypothetical protein